jgi:Holliday junction resolvase RusA-like endonuclease
LEVLLKVVLQLSVDPTPWKAPRLGRKGVYSPHNDIKRKIKHYIRQQYQDLPYSGYTSLFFCFAFATPTTASKIQKQRMLNREIFPTRIDCTNMQKLFEDCLQGIVITNDKNVISVTSYKFYADDPSVTIVVQDHNEYIEEHEKGINDEVEKRKKGIQSDARMERG